MLVTIGLQAEREFLGGEDTMGGLGSGGQRRAHRWVGSCAELNVHPLLARGCLEPGRSSTWTFSGVGAGDAPAAISISLRCDEAGRELGDVTELSRGASGGATCEPRAMTA